MKNIFPAHKDLNLKDIKYTKEKKTSEWLQFKDDVWFMICIPGIT